jgi:hypothetical protein
MGHARLSVLNVPDLSQINAQNALRARLAQGSVLASATRAMLVHSARQKCTTTTLATATLDVVGVMALHLRLVPLAALMRTCIMTTVSVRSSGMVMRVR